MSWLRSDKTNGSLPAGHLNSHCNVGLDQAGCRATGAGLGTGALPWVPPPAALGSERQRLGLWTTGSIYPDTCCFGGEVRAGPVCVRMRTGPLGCPQCVCVCVCEHVHTSARVHCARALVGWTHRTQGSGRSSDRSESSQDHMLLPGPLPFPPLLSTTPLSLEHSGCVCVSSSLFLSCG